MKKTVILLVIAACVLSSCMAFVAAYIYEEAEDRDPNYGVSYPWCAYAWARVAGHYHPETQTYTSIEHNHDGYSFFQHYFDFMDSDNPYHPKTHTYIYVWVNGSYHEGAHAYVTF